MSDQRPIIYGEVLFDCFEGESCVLGGAPFNVAWHLQGFGLRPVMISRIGDDDRGEQVIEAMENWGMSLKGIQRDAVHPTGQVKIWLEQGQPSYEILPDQAYDFIDPDEVSEAISDIDCSLLYHGSLAMRNPASANAFSALLESISLPRFIDVNLREPWWRNIDLKSLIEGAEWVKLNDQEMVELMGPNAVVSLEDGAAAMRQQFQLNSLVVTQGADGALLHTDKGNWNAEPKQRVQVVDTVGAGDAFSAVVLLGLTFDWPYPEILDRAIEFAAAVCTRRGATIDDIEFYRKFGDEWNIKS